MIETNVNSISKFDAWIMASRPRTLLAAFVPVITGTAIAYVDGGYNLFFAFLALICSVLIQVGTNFVNDLYDFIYGSDTEERVGPTRALANGLLTKFEMQIGIVFTFGLAFSLGMIMVVHTGWPVLAIGITSILAGIAYTAGPYPLAYNGLGDLFVFIFFGLVGTVGTYYVQAGTVSELAVWASIPVGALITNILVVNNYRDIYQDQKAGKLTLAVKYGEAFTRAQYLVFMIISFIVPFVVYFTYKQSLFVLLPLLVLPMAIKLIKMIYTLKGKKLNKTLELTAKLSLFYGILFAVGLLI